MRKSKVTSFVGKAASLILADGSKWCITAQDSRASIIVSRLTELMHLQSQYISARQILVFSSETNNLNETPLLKKITPLITFSSGDKNNIVCKINSNKDGPLLIIRVS